jgi:IclR family KDG regulon transcriptional repressor
MENLEKKPKIQAVSRAVDILRCFIEKPELGLTEISQMVSLHKSTTSGIVSTLCAEGLLEQSVKSGKYRLGLEIFRLSKSVNQDIHDLCHPFLLQLLDDVGETVNLAMLDNKGSVIYIDKLESPHSMRICSRVGQRLPFHCTATGKVLVSCLEESERQKVLDSFVPSIYTTHTICDRAAFEQELLDCRRNGYACDREEYEYGLICYAVPIQSSGTYPQLAVSVSGPAIRMSDENCHHILECLQKTSRLISGAISTYL